MFRRLHRPVHRTHQALTQILEAVSHMLLSIQTEIKVFKFSFFPRSGIEGGVARPPEIVEAGIVERRLPRKGRRTKAGIGYILDHSE